MSYRYQRVFTQIWHDEKFHKLSDDAKTLFIYFLTSPHSNAIGCYALPTLYIEADLRFQEKRLKKAFESVLKSGLIKYDEATTLIFIPNHLKYNPPVNPNQKKNMVTLISQLPKSHLISDLKTVCQPFLNGLSTVWERFDNGFETVSKQETETETETEEETERCELFGEFKNVKLSKEQHQKLKDRFGESGAKERIENLSTAIASKGYKYKSHYATILSWDKKNNPPPQGPFSPQPGIKAFYEKQKEKEEKV